MLIGRNVMRMFLYMVILYVMKISICYFGI